MLDFFKCILDMWKTVIVKNGLCFTWIKFLSLQRYWPFKWHVFMYQLSHVSKPFQLPGIEQSVEHDRLYNQLDNEWTARSFN